MYKYLNRLDHLKVIHYLPQKKTPFIIYLKERIDPKRLVISPENYHQRKKKYLDQVNAVIDYAASTAHCRSQLLLAYFGETGTSRCGKCDVCESLANMGMSNLEFERLSDDARRLLQKKPLFRHELFFNLKGDDDKKQQAIRWLIDNEKIIVRVDERLEWKM